MGDHNTAHRSELAWLSDQVFKIVQHKPYQRVVIFTHHRPKYGSTMYRSKTYSQRSLYSFCYGFKWGRMLGFTHGFGLGIWSNFNCAPTSKNNKIDLYDIQIYVCRTKLATILHTLRYFSINHILQSLSDLVVWAIREMPSRACSPPSRARTPVSLSAIYNG